MGNLAREIAARDSYSDVTRPQVKKERKQESRSTKHVPTFDIYRGFIRDAWVHSAAIRRLGGASHMHSEAHKSALIRREL